MSHIVDDFQLGERAMRYSLFVPRLYNYCLSLGFERGLMMPSRAFCSDESQGYPVILLTQHFGAFPFDHGRVGGKVATNRHGPHAHHGEDLIIIQASHVGYDPARQKFGVYQRLRTADRGFGDNCGKLCAVLHWYQKECQHARRKNHSAPGCQSTAGPLCSSTITCWNAGARPCGALFLHLDRLVAAGDGGPLKSPEHIEGLVAAAPALVALLPSDIWSSGRALIGDRLTADMFSFPRAPSGRGSGRP